MSTHLSLMQYCDMSIYMTSLLNATSLEHQTGKSLKQLTVYRLQACWRHLCNGGLSGLGNWGAHTVDALLD